MTNWFNKNKVFAGANIVPIVGVTLFVLFYLILLLSFNYVSFLNEMEDVVKQGDLDSHKMRLNSELMEIARTRTRITNQIIDVEDPFMQDELNVELEILANRFSKLRNELIQLELSPDEKQILLVEHAVIVGSILPAQREVVDLAMSGSPDNLKKARELLYDIVLPGQGRMVNSFGRMISLEQKRIEELSQRALEMGADSRKRVYFLIGLVVTVSVVMSGLALWHISKIQRALVDSHQNLEKTVHERTEELSNARDDLQHKMNLVDRYVITSTSDPDGVITYASDAFCQISKYDASELVGQPHSILRHPDMPSAVYEDMWGQLKAGKPWKGEIQNRAKDGSAYWVDVNIDPNFDADGNITGYVAVRQDITDKKRIQELSITDTLTQLHNRLKLDETLDREIERASRYQHPLSIILFDIDHFKKVNDTYGHQVGDYVLVQIAKIIKSIVRTTDVAGRWGGEEFLVVCTDTSLQGAIELAGRLRTAIEEYPFEVVGRVTSSFGVAAFKPGMKESTLLAQADEALYRAKGEGRNRVAIA